MASLLDRVRGKKSSTPSVLAEPTPDARAAAAAEVESIARRLAADASTSEDEHAIPRALHIARIDDSAFHELVDHLRAIAGLAGCDAQHERAIKDAVAARQAMESHHAETARIVARRQAELGDLIAKTHAATREVDQSDRARQKHCTHEWCVAELLGKPLPDLDHVTPFTVGEGINVSDPSAPLLMVPVHVVREQSHRRYAILRRAIQVCAESRRGTAPDAVDWAWVMTSGRLAEFAADV